MTPIKADGSHPSGQTIVTWSATNADNLTSTCEQVVTVVDNKAPIISSVAVNPSTLWPPKHDMVDVTVSYEAADNCAFETSLGNVSLKTLLSECREIMSEGRA
ncbi:MAG TPA: hypothetical protein VF088_12000 [Pyrinomonadaceae bacterium]